MSNVLYNLTNPQKSIWLTEQYYKNSSIGNLCGYILIKTDVDYELLNKTVQKIIELNDCFRIKIVLDKNNIPHQYFSDYSFYNMNLLELKNEKELIEKQKEIASKPFNFINSELFSFTPFKLKNNYGGLILNMHHIIADAWSFSLIITQIAQIYKSLMRNEDFTPNCNSYIDYILSERNYLSSQKYINDEAYWNSIYTSAPEIATFPSPKYMNINRDSSLAKRKTFTLQKRLIKKIKKLCTTEKVSIFNFFMAIISLYTGHISNLDEFVIRNPRIK